MTLSEKILAAHAGLSEVSPGQIVSARLDIVMANDITGPVGIREFAKMGGKKVFDRSKVVLVPDHFTPNKDIASAENAKIMRDFARAQGILHYWEVGVAGIEHCLLPEQGVVLPGDLVIGADSHTCTYGALGAFATGVGSTDFAAGMALGETWFKVPPTLKFVFHGAARQDYVGGKDFILHIIGKIGVDGARYKAMEFTGEGIAALSMDHRFTISNMAIEAGGKAGLIAPDSVTESYVKARAERPYTLYHSDTDAVFENVTDIDTASIEPQVAFPHSPENTRNVRDASHIKIDQVVIGSCTNGRLEDIAQAARLLKGRKVHREIRCLIFPGTRQIYLDALRLGYVETLIEAGASVNTPSCGPCIGGHMGVLAKGEKALSTTNRNFIGRMGHPESEIYLTNPAVAAASAVRGEICHPEELT